MAKNKRRTIAVEFFDPFQESVRAVWMGKDQLEYRCKMILSDNKRRERIEHLEAMKQVFRKLGDDIIRLDKEIYKRG